MLTGKQRRYLKGLANGIDQTVYVGKAGVTPNIIQEMENGFEARELVKIKLQDGCDLTKDQVADAIIQETKCEFVQAIGRKVTLYRRSKDHRKIELPR